MNYATLCFLNRDAAIAAAKSLGFWNPEDDRINTQGQTIRDDGTAFSWMIDEIGIVIDVPAVFDPETGTELQPATYKPGWYVNVIGELPDAITPYIVPYGSGGRVFAGTEPER